MRLTIIIAAYNVEAFLERCVRSCDAIRSRELVEILIVDDGSTDATPKIAARLQAQLPNLKVIRQQNRGLGASRNVGIQNAKGKYMWMIDGDDYLEPGALDVVLEQMTENLDVYCVNYNVADAGEKVLYKGYPEHYIGEVLTGAAYYDLNYEKNYTWQYIFRKDLFVENRLGFKERINMQDSEILPQVMLYAKSVKYLDLVGYNYVQYAHSFTNTHDPQKRYDYFRSIIEVRDSLQRFGPRVQAQHPLLYSGIQKKLGALDQVVLSHLVFYRYKSSDFRKNLALLKRAGFYPLKANVRGRMKIVKYGINIFPRITNAILSLFKK